MQKVFLVLFVVVLGIFIDSQTVNTLKVTNDVLLENVEALADIENSGSDIRYKCLMTGENKCPINGVKVVYVIEGLSLGEDDEIY